MNIQTATRADVSKKLEEVLISGDLSSLSAAERVSYNNAVCASMGLNPLTKPFEYIKLNGKLVLYARRDAADQLRKVHNVSITVSGREVLGDVYVVTARATMSGGRTDEATGAVSIKGLSGESLANAYMKAETKAKRRVTLSICGLGMLDETEVSSVREVSPAKANQVNALLHEPAREVELEPDAEEPDFLTEAAAQEPMQENLADYVIKIGKKHKGKKLSEMSKSNLCEFRDWVESNIENKNADTVEFIEKASAYLESV